MNPIPDLRLGAPDVLLYDIENAGWRCGVPLGAETPGLMTGLAGSGYGLLRGARATQYPPSCCSNRRAAEPPRCCNKGQMRCPDGLLVSAADRFYSLATR